jgi:ribosomal protein L29
LILSYEFKGRAWKTGELRLKSFDDLHTLWFVLLKEKNMLLSERERCRHNKVRLARPDRLVKVRQSMARIMAVLDERKKVQLGLQEFQKDHLLSSEAAEGAVAETNATPHSSS